MSVSHTRMSAERRTLCSRHVPRVPRVTRAAASASHHLLVGPSSSSFVSTRSSRPSVVAFLSSGHLDCGHSHSHALLSTSRLSRTARRQANAFTSKVTPKKRNYVKPKAGPLAVIFNPVTIIIYVFTFIKIWTNIDKTTYDKEKRMQLALLWPVLAITNANFRSALAKMVTS